MTLPTLDGSTKVVASEEIDGLRQRLRGPLLQSDSEGYDAATRIWNGVHRKRPGLIAVCTGVADVIDIVNFAREHALLVSLRGGGHKIVEQGETSRVISHPLHPYTERLIASVPPADPTVRRAPIRLVSKAPLALSGVVGCAFAARCPEVDEVCRRVAPPLEVKRSGHLAACHQR